MTLVLGNPEFSLYGPAAPQAASPTVATIKIPEVRIALTREVFRRNSFSQMLLCRFVLLDDFEYFNIITYGQVNPNSLSTFIGTFVQPTSAVPKSAMTHCLLMTVANP